MNEMPSAQRLTEVWSEVVNSLGDDCMVLMLASTAAGHEETGLLSAFQPSSSAELLATVMSSVAEGAAMGLFADGCPWGALLAPSFLAYDEPPSQHGELQERYMAGDERVSHVLSIVRMRYREKPTISMFRQPLMEPEDVETEAMNGAMTVVLGFALEQANV